MKSVDPVRKPPLVSSPSIAINKQVRSGKIGAGKWVNPGYYRTFSLKYIQFLRGWWMRNSLLRDKAQHDSCRVWSLLTSYQISIG